MTLRLQIIVICMVTILYFCMFRLIKRKELDLRYAFGWMILGATIIFLALCPEMLGRFSAAVGILSPVNMLFFFGFCLSMCIIFTLSMAVSHLNDKVKRLAQELAILRRQVYEYCGKNGEGEQDHTAAGKE